MKKPEARILSVDDVTALRKAVIDAVEEMDANDFNSEGIDIMEEMFIKCVDIIYGREDFHLWMEERINEE